MQLSCQSEETLLRIREQLLFRGASQSAMRRRWLSLCTLWTSHSQISFSTAILALGKTRSRREPKLDCKESDRPGWCDVLQKEACMRAVEWAGALSWLNWSARSVIVNATVETHTLSQRRLTTDWLAPRESEWSRMHSKVSSDWLPGYIKAARPVLEVLKMARYFSEYSRMYIGLQIKYPIFLSDFN